MKHPNAYNLNNTIQQMEDKIWSFIEEKTKKKEIITSDSIKTFLRGKEKPKDTLLSAFDYFISNHCQSLNKGTTNHYISTKNKLSSFLSSCKLPLFLDHFWLEFLGVFSNSRETD